MNVGEPGRLSEKYPPASVEDIRVERNSQELPDEIILAALSTLSAVDVARSSMVCRSWHHVASAEKLWFRLYCDEWRHCGDELFSPLIGGYYYKAVLDIKEDELLYGFDSWQQTFVARVHACRLIKVQVEQLCWPARRSCSLAAIAQTCLPSEAAAGWRLHQLREFVASDDSKHVGLRHFASMALKSARLEHNCASIRSLLEEDSASETRPAGLDVAVSATSPTSSPPTLLERGCLLISCLVQSDKEGDAHRVGRALDRLGRETRRRIEGCQAAMQGLVEEDPNYLPALTILNEFLFGDRSEDAAGETDLLCEECAIPTNGGLGFVGNRDDYYNAANSSLAQVLATRAGIPITLAVVHHAVGARCGVPVDMAGIPCHFLTRVGRAGSASERFSDNFDGGRLLTRGEVVLLLQTMQVDDHARALEPTPPAHLFLRICNNLINVYKTAPSDTERLLATLTMGLAIQPHNYHMRKLRARVAIVLHDLDVVTADDLLAQDLEARAIVGRAREMKALQLREAEVQHRRPCSVACQLAGPDAATSAADLLRDPALHVGMVVLNTRYQYRGVVCEWDGSCQRDEDWIKRLQVDKLPRGRNQAFYTILVESNGNVLTSYTAEEDLRRLAPGEASEVNHPEVGKYFRAFDPCSGYYIPNDYLIYRYPDDEPTTLVSKGFPSGMDLLHL